jgi:isoquinoline 1-oxidoreductase beta subunit
MNEIMVINRRSFLKAAALFGGGLIIGVTLSDESSEAQPNAPKKSFMPNAFIRIGSDNSVTIIVNKSEMGQGVYTSLPMLIAEELEVDWSTIRVEAAPVDPAYNHADWKVMQGTGGSTSIKSEWTRLRKAGAAARIMLIAAAAQVWNVKPESCRAEQGFVLHPPTRRSLSYGALAEKAAKIALPETVPLKPDSQLKLLGKAMKRLDTPIKVNGTAVFGIDAGDKNLLVALVAHPPVFGGRIRSLSSEKAQQVPGVREIIELDSGVAVVADSFWAAERGRDALEIVWNEGPMAAVETEKLRQEYAALAKMPGAIARQQGDVELALKNVARTIEAEYEVPYLAHATMEPMNCVVDLRSDRCEIWTGTQFQTADRDAAARVAGLPPERVLLHTMFLGCGFGRRSNPASDFVIEAVKIAKALKKPVKMIWTREDDMKAGFYRPMWYDHISAGIDAKGMPLAWRHKIVGQCIMEGTAFAGSIKNGVDKASVEGADDLPYAIANIYVDLHSPKSGVPVLWWRSVGHSHTAFVVESFLDELAHIAGQDPYQYRLALLKEHPRHKAVLNRAAEMAGWGRPLPQGHFHGIALHASFGSYVAQVAEVSVNREGSVRVHKVACAVDCGKTVNPDTIVAQMEGGIVFGLSAALYGAITFKKGRVEQSNFHDYPVLRMHEMPEVSVAIIKSSEAPGGIGEPGVPPIAPAVCNAIFAATGRRIRRLPIQPDELKRT